MTQMAELVDSDNRKATSMLSQSMKTLCSKTHLRKHAWEKSSKLGNRGRLPGQLSI